MTNKNLYQNRKILWFLNKVYVALKLHILIEKPQVISILTTMSYIMLDSYMFLNKDEKILTILKNQVFVCNSCRSASSKKIVSRPDLSKTQLCAVHSVDCSRCAILIQITYFLLRAFNQQCLACRLGIGQLLTVLKFIYCKKTTKNRFMNENKGEH